MNDNAVFLTHRVACIAGKQPPTVVVCSQTVPYQGQRGISCQKRTYSIKLAAQGLPDGLLSWCCLGYTRRL